MTIKFTNEFQLSPTTSIAINKLLQKSFSYVDYKGRDYFKQLPHYRLLAYEADKLVGQLAIDYRVMNLNGAARHVFGIVDLCVADEEQGKGIGKKLLVELTNLATQYLHKIDALFLVTETPAYYQQMGFVTIKLTTTWLKIDEHKNYGIGQEHITDASFMVKQISDKQWEDGELDLLGYMY